MDDGKALLISFLKNDSPDVKVAKLRGFQSCDWDNLLLLSRRFGITPLLYKTLKPFFAEIGVSDELQERLKDAYVSSTTRNMRLYGQLLRLVRTFNHEGIPVILLKGAHLAEVVYGDIALRPMIDLDLLVRNSDISRTCDLMVRQNYNYSKEDVGCAAEHLAPFSKKGFVRVEIHFNIVPPPFFERFDVAELWERARKESIQGVEVLTLCPEDLFLHVCVHTCIHHCFDNGVIPFLDVARTLDHYEQRIDWEILLERGRQWGASRCVYLMLVLTDKMIGLNLPEHARLKISEDSFYLDFAKDAEELVFQDGGSMVSNVARLLGNESWSSKIKLLFGRIFPAPDSFFPMEQGRRNRFSLIRIYFFRIKGLWKRHWKTLRDVFLKRDKRILTSADTANRRNRLKDWLIQAP